MKNTSNNTSLDKDRRKLLAKAYNKTLNKQIPDIIKTSIQHINNTVFDIPDCKNLSITEVLLVIKNIAIEISNNNDWSFSTVCDQVAKALDIEINTVKDKFSKRKIELDFRDIKKFLIEDSNPLNSPFAKAILNNIEDSSEQSSVKAFLETCIYIVRISCHPMYQAYKLRQIRINNNRA